MESCAARDDGLAPCACEKCAAAEPTRAATRSERRRFLAGAKGDAGKAAHLLSASLRWRAEEGVDDLAAVARGSAPPTDAAAATLALEPRVDALYPAVLLPGRARNGDAVVVQCLGRCLVGPLLEDVEGVLRVSTLRIERAMVVADRRVLVLDCEQLAASALRGLPAFKKLIDLMQRHYPETVSSIIVVNSPLLVWAAYKTVKPWLDPTTAAKVQLFSWRDAEGAFAALSALMEPGVAPSRYGGAGDGLATARLDALCAALDAGEVS